MDKRQLVKKIHALKNDKRNYMNQLQAEALIEEYAKKLCDKQKKIIAEGLPDECFMPTTYIDEGHILNMPVPDFDNV